MANVDNFVKNVQNHMRGDPGIGNDAEHQISQITWILFLKVYYVRELKWSLNGNYHSIIPKKYQWPNWAKNGKNALTGPELVQFVNNDLIPHLKNIPVTPNTPNRQAILPEVFHGVINHMHKGVLLRKVINDVDGLDLANSNGNDVVADIYEHILGQMQSQKASGEYYTPRPLTDFVTSQLHIKLGDKIGDMAVGTGGFLTSALKVLRPQIKKASDFKVYSNSIYGKELHFLPFMLCVTNLFLHGVDNPEVIQGDSLSKNVGQYQDDDKFDVICMNPPYGQNPDDSDLTNFPYNMRSDRLEYLFLILVMCRLKLNGRVGIVLPDGFMFGTSDVAQRIKSELFNKFNVKLIVRLPRGVFSPYTPNHTNVVFFDNIGSTKSTWFYRIDLPKGMKDFTKTRPITRKSFVKVRKWIEDPHEIKHGSDTKAEKVSIAKIKNNHYNLDTYASYNQGRAKIEDPVTLLNKYFTQKKQYDQKINTLAKDVKQILGGDSK